MIIKAKTRGFICTNAHPVGCEQNVRNQIAYVKNQGQIDGAPKRVLVLGSSTGYGLASRISAAFGAGAKTMGVFFEKEPSEKRTATAGWYNTAAFHKAAEEEGLYARSFNGDAFSNEMKSDVINAIKEDFGQVDLVVYSLAAPRRQHPDTGEVFNSVLKPIGQSVTKQGVDTNKDQITEFSLDQASQEEIDQTVAVMGGDDWQRWMTALADAGVLADNAKTTAYTYLGERVTWDIYWHGTIGAAKKDLDRAAKDITEQLTNIGATAHVSVLKAVVTQASSAIPIMPLYLALLFKIMKEEGTHEGCIEQVYRLFNECLYNQAPRLDDENRYRVDELELTPHVQQEVEALWAKVTTDNLKEISDYSGYKTEFLRLFGFEVEGVDYDADVSPLADIQLG
ncbi:enoyl-ACP reductase FabV [Umboniibacter marinipuniceus]|uniref:Enoyl-[acyl-carrier-protein] reductase [NADH] n=1 Tax=Umboniibacter marinipuniceus TaxID=569599 RepID=A0A3M0AJM9_9GAMM|nr:enoyl-ACP reductase FabV [Umboniibacter marinipuniceus]RMA79242.1 enoyl-[acyl-carrier protein] reductase/trans-2-enoyl-CoA reductase (NAD+) [Umboniibacter marinipuniceus]